MQHITNSKIDKVVIDVDKLDCDDNVHKGIIIDLSGKDHNQSYDDDTDTNDAPNNTDEGTHNQSNNDNDNHTHSKVSSERNKKIEIKPYASDTKVYALNPNGALHLIHTGTQMMLEDKKDRKGAYY